MNKNPLNNSTAPRNASIKIFVSTTLALAGIFSANIFAASENIGGDEKSIRLDGTKDWMAHPMVLEIRRLYREVEDGIQGGRLEGLVRQARTPGLECSVSLAEQRFWAWPSGSVASYHQTLYSEHSALSQQAYYDRQERPRFVFSVQQSYYEESGLGVLEYRTYLTEEGDVFHHDIRRTSPGVVFGAESAEELIEGWVNDPLGSFVKNGCIN